MSGNTTQSKPAKLEDQIRDACRVRHYSLATERSYVRWYRQFVRWAGLKHPATLGGDRVEAWLSHLATDRDVAASTQRQASNCSGIQNPPPQGVPVRVWPRAPTHNARAHANL